LSSGWELSWSWELGVGGRGFGLAPVSFPSIDRAEGSGWE
jgi:hypothetical protein